MSSTGFLPAVVDILLIWFKFTRSSPFILLILRMLTFMLAISCLTTSNLPWFMDLIFQVPMKNCSLQHQTTSSTSHIHNWVLFLLWLHLFSGVISTLFSSSILGTYQPGDSIFQCHIFLPLHTFHEVLEARVLKWFAIPFSNGPCFFRILHHDPPVLGGSTQHGSVSFS